MAKSYLELIDTKIDKDHLASKDKNEDIKMELCVIKNLSLEILEICLENKKG